MNPTTIEWVLNPDGSPGFTSNPFTGCLGPKGDGINCPYCYAKQLANGRLKPLYLANRNFPPSAYFSTDSYCAAKADPFYPRYWPERLKDFYVKSPKGIFVCDMSDWAAPWIPMQWKEQLMAAISNNPQHRFYLLTHQPQELQKWSPYPENCWVGVTVTNYQEYLRATGVFCRVPLIKAEVKFLSIEPLLTWRIPTDHLWLMHAGIGWLIIGAMTGKRKELMELSDRYPHLTLTQSLGKWTLQPKLEWILEIAEAADKANIPVFLKLNLVPMIADSLDPAKLKLYPDGMHLRQEMPGGEAW